MSESPAIVFAVVEQILADRAAGTARTRDEYRAMFPDYESIVDRELERVANPEHVDSRPAAAAAFAPGRSGERISGYRLIEEIGRGGQGAVFLADDEKLGRRVAVKILLEREAVSFVARERFRREAMVLSRLDHPGIATVFEAGDERGVAYVAMRFVAGETLARRIAKERAKDHAPADRDGLFSKLAVIEEAARALHAAHEAGIVHRDVKPGNLMLTPEGHVVVLDFGLARDLDDSAPTLTASGDIHGTPAYMSPEQLSPTRVRLDARTDVFSLGVTFYEHLAGQRPFDATTREGLFHAILTQDPPPLRYRIPSAPRDLEIVIDTALAKDRNRRYSTALAFADDLRAVQQRRPIAARRPSLVARVSSFCLREPVKAGLVAAVMVALVVAAGSLGYVFAQSQEIREGKKALRRDEIDRAIVSGFGTWKQPPLTKTLTAILEQDPGLDLVRITLALGRIEHLQAREALAVCDGGTSEDARAALDRIRIAALRTLDRAAEADELEARRGSVGVESGPFEHYVAGSLIQFEKSNDPSDAKNAAAHFLQAVLRSPRAELVFHYRATLGALFADQNDQALDGAATLAQLWPESALAWFAIGTVRGSNSDSPGALSAFERAVTLDPTFVEAWTNLGLAHLILGNTDAADAAYLRAAAIDARGREPGILQAQWGDMLYRAQRFENAIPILRESLAQNPSRIRTTKVLIASLRKVKRPSEAVPIARELAEREPRDDEASRLLRKALEENGEIEAAIAEFDRWLALAPDDADATSERTRLSRLREQDSDR